jgi:hypothetical protein
VRQSTSGIAIRYSIDSGMRYARDDRAKKDVDAHEIGERARSHAYSCPSCGARVHYKRSIGLSPNPIFAHNPHEGSQDCENYYPWQGGFDIASPPSPPASRPSVAVEDTPDELGLCLEDADNWTTYLRVPEISTEELGNLSPRALISAFVEVESFGESNRLPLIDLRPGVGSARLPVPPMTSAYKVTTTGSWPAGVRERRWQTTSRGLSSRGTLFRLRHGEWVRLREGSPVELGEELRVVADQRNVPPAECQPQAGRVVSFRSQNWRMWRVALPLLSNMQFEAWAEAISVDVVEPAWDLRIASIPEAVDAGSQLPVFPSQSTLVARLRSPRRGARADISLSAGSARHSDSFSTARGTDIGFLAFSVAWPGSNELRVSYDDRSAVRFETRDAQSLSDLKRALASVPTLRVMVGETVVQPWGEAFEIPIPAPNETAPKIRLLPDLEDLRVSLRWEGQESQGAVESLSPENASRRLNAFFELRRGTRVRIDSGALGSVKLHFRPAMKAKSATAAIVKRRARWLSVAVEHRESAEGTPLPAAAIRSASALDRRIFLATSKHTNSKWTALMLRTLKEAKA